MHGRTAIKPRLAFVSLWDSAAPNIESGYGYSMRRQLQKRFEVIDIFPLALAGEQLFLPVRAAYRLAGRYYHPMREPALLKPLARRIERALKEVRPDIVFAPSSLPLTFVEFSRPLAHSTDQVFCDFVESYIRSPSERFRRLGNAQEQRALATASRVTYPAYSAARSAVDTYGADPAKVVVIPWGANLPQELPEDEVRYAISTRRLDRCHLVFLGVNWQRKGGDTLVATVDALNRSGIETHATIIGCTPSGLPPDRFTIHPFLDKRNPEHFALLKSILMGATFFFLPSRAEAFGQAFCEAAAFGLPLIGSTAGGIPTIIKEGETGFLRAPDAPAEAFAAPIRATLAEPMRYREMALAARRDHLQRLNWNAFGEKLCGIMEAAL
jgi:glycosyltransferase involved in cell wall biosynthesis